MGYKTTCPQCKGHNFYVTPHNQFGYCFNCHYYKKDGEQDYTPKQMSPNVDSIRELYTQAAKYYHNSIDTRARDYLYNRGFTDQTIKDLQIGYVPTGKSPLYKGDIAKDAGIAYYDGTAFLSDRISFPYLSENGTVTDIRGRSLDPLDEAKYKSLLGSSYYRGAIYPYNYHLHCNNVKRILITEGEIKADIAVQFNYPTLGLPGMLAWRDGFVQSDAIDYVLVFDNQRRRYYEVRQAIIKAARHIKDVKVATLPLLGRDKQDIDSFILNYGIDAFHIVIESAIDYNTWYSLQRF